MKNAHVPGKNLIVKSSLILDPSQLTPVEEALVLAQQYLGNFTSEPDFGQKMAIAFGEGANVDSLRTAWSANDFSNFPEIEVRRHAADINGANGAFAAATNKIYLSQEFIINHQGDVGAIASVLLEEFGHFVDSQLNEVDSLGDEGEIFSALVRGETLSKVQLEQLKAEDDTATIMLNGQAIHIEQDSNEPGINITPLTPLVTTEAGGTAKFSVQLNSQPTDDVIITGRSSNEKEGILDTSSLVFTPNNWNIPQIVTVIGVDDLINDGDVTYSIIGDAVISNDPIYREIGKNPSAYTFININDDKLDVAISSNKNLIGIGSEHQIIYTFNITNNGTENTTGVKLETTIPKGVNLIGSSLTIINQTTDSEGNTLLTIDAGSISQGSVFTGTVTVEATGFSQPLDKLQDYLWNIDVKGIATANISGAIVSSNTASISTQIDSSKGLAEDLVKSFFFGDVLNQTNSLKTLTSSQKVTASSENEEGLTQVGDELVNDVITAVASPVVKTLQTVQDTFSEQTKAFKDLDPIKGIEATQAGVKNTEQQVNQFPDNVKQGVEQAGVKAVRKGVGLLVDSAAQALISGSYQALKLTVPEGLSYSDGVVNYEKETSTDKVNLGVTVGKIEKVPQAILQSALAGNTSQIQSWANSTVNNFTAQGLYSKTLPNGQVGLNFGYSNATKTLSYGLETSLSLGNGFQLGGKVEGQFGQGQSRPTGFLSVIYTEPEPKNPPQGNRSVSPQSYTNNLENNFQSILAFGDSTFSEPANLSQSIQSLTNGNDNSSTPILDKSGRFLVFTSEASNLIEGDTNGVTDVFIRSIQTNTLERISLSNDGTEANGKSEGFAISADGRYVVFASNASNLIANDSNNARDIFVRDRIANTTKRVSLANDSSQANGASDLAAISANGRYIVFSSIASNLVAGDTNEMVDVFVRDLEAGTTELISAASNNSQSNNDSLSSGAAISADGRYVVFYSYASNLVANDTNDLADIFVRDRQTGSTVRVSAADDGTEGNDISLSPAISADGRYIAFSSLASNLVAGDTNDTGDIFVYDQQTKTIERVSLASDETEADSNSSRPSISSDGRYVVFQSRAANLGVDNPNLYSNIYLRDRLTGETKLVSPSLNGETDGDNINPSISADGSYISFESGATNLVDGDTNDASDIFVYKPVTLENSEPVTGANKTLTVLEDTAPISLAIAIPSDADNDPLTITVTTVAETTKGEIRLPNNTIVTANTSLTTEQLTSLVFAPVTNANGSAGTFSYTVSDGKGGIATQTLTLEITAVNDPPTAADDTATINQNTPLTLSIANLLANDSDIDSNSLSITAVSNGTNGSVVFDTEQGNIVFTPILNFSGAASFNYTVSDGNGGNSMATVAVTVNPSSQLNKITGTPGRDTLTGTSKSDHIIGLQGADTLTGGCGNDQFVYTNIRDRGDTITDFEVGKDNIVFTQLLNSLVTGGYNGTNAIADGYVKVVQGTSASNFSVQIDADGPTGNDIFRPFITVNLAGTGTFNNPSNFVF